MICAFCGEREASVMLPSGGALRPECDHCAALPVDETQAGLIAADIVASALMGAAEVN
jgi:hypothetical protein